MFNEEGNEVSVFQMKVDDSNFPLGDVTNFDEYLNLKPPKRLKKEQNKVMNVKFKDDSLKEGASTLRTHRTYKKEQTDFFFSL